MFKEGGSFHKAADRETAGSYRQDGFGERQGCSSQGSPVRYQEVVSAACWD